MRSETVVGGRKVEKRIYSLTPEGRSELLRWITQPFDETPERDAVGLKAAYLDMVSDDVARGHYEEHRAYYQRRLMEWEEWIAKVQVLDHPLPQRCLITAPKNQRERLVALKLRVLKKNAERAQLEIGWADEALALLDRVSRPAVSSPTPRSARCHRGGSPGSERGW